MRDQSGGHDSSNRDEGADGRRRALRALLLTAANAARQGRRIPEIAGRIQPVGRAIRERVSMLISAAS